MSDKRSYWDGQDLSGMQQEEHILMVEKKTNAGDWERRLVSKMANWEKTRYCFERQKKREFQQRFCDNLGQMT